LQVFGFLPISPIVLAKEFTPCQLHNPSCIVEDFAGSYDFARPCFLKAKALFKEIKAIIQLVVCKLGEVRRG